MADDTEESLAYDPEIEAQLAPLREKHRSMGCGKKTSVGRPHEWHYSEMSPRVSEIVEGVGYDGEHNV